MATTTTFGRTTLAAGTGTADGMGRGGADAPGIILYRESRTADPASYLSDFPTWEPRPDDLMTPDGRKVETHKAIRRSDTGEIIGIVGEGYVLRSHAQLAADLDAVAAPFGGRASLGPAKVLSHGARVSAVVRLPREFEGALAVPGDKSPRSALMTLRDSRDGTLRESVSIAIMRQVCTNGLMVAEAGMTASAKHTSGIAWLTRDLDRWAPVTARSILGTGERLRSLAERRVTMADVRTFAQAIGNPDKADKGQAKVREDKIIEMVLSANGHYVPAYDAFRAVQLLEAATAWDRHYAGNGRATDPAHVAFRRLERLAEGDGLAPRAWSYLDAMLAA